MAANNYLITTDSGCGLSLELCRRRGVFSYKMPYTMDGVVRTDEMTGLGVPHGGLRERLRRFRPHRAQDRLNIVPILHLDYAGRLEVWQKVRGSKQYMARPVQDVKELVVGAAAQTLIISEADAPDRAREYGRVLKAEAGFRDAFHTHIGPTIGAHIGPGLISVFFIGKERV